MKTAAETAEPRYLGFTPNTPEDHARAAFLARYDEEPAEVIRTAGGLLVGPIGNAGTPQPQQQGAAPGQLALFSTGGNL
jgi:hypothetical protein